MELAISINWGLVNKDAVAYSKQSQYEHVQGLTPAQRAAFQIAFSTWIGQGNAIPVLIEQVANILGDVARAEVVTRTEVTRIRAMVAVAGWVQRGYVPPLLLPPLCDGCRCFLQPWKMPDNQRVIVWLTCNDDWRCMTPFALPWGTVNGCKGLHGLIISSGAHMGRRRPGL